MIKKFVSLAVVVAVAAAIGCAKKTEVSQVKNIEKQVQSEVITQIKISPVSAKIALGESKEFTVTGVDRKGKTVPIAATWKLDSGKNLLGTLSSTKGEKVAVKGVAAGKGTIEAEYNKIKATAAIEVTKKK